MKLNQIKLLYSLFFKSSNFMLRLSVSVLPIIIAISFAAIFFINNLSDSYKNYLLQSYVGTQGILTVKSNDTNYLKNLQNKYQKQNINCSLKGELRREIVIKTTTYNLKKKIKIILLEDKYLKSKFKLGKNKIIINNILKNILNDISDIEFKNPNSKKFIKIENIKVIDTGFLSSEPLIFMNKDMFTQLNYKFKNLNLLELNIPLNKVESSKEIARKLSEIDGSDVNFKDVLSEHQQTQELFNNIGYIEYTILFITSVLAFIILTASISIIATIKEKAISLFRIYGLSTNLIAFTLFLISIVFLSFSILLAYILFLFMKSYFIVSIGLNESFFLALNHKVILMTLSIFMIFSSSTYIWAIKKFKGKIEL